MADVLRPVETATSISVHVRDLTAGQVASLVQVGSLPKGTAAVDYIGADIVAERGVEARRVAWHHTQRHPELRAATQQDLGHELLRVQLGLMPNNYKTMPDIGAGTYEIRVSDPDGIARLMDVAKFRETVYVLHVFEKKTQRTPRRLSGRIRRQGG